MLIQGFAEHEVPCEVHSDLTALRNACFPGCEVPRSYGKQLPHLRVLAQESGSLVGYLGIDHRVVRFGLVPTRIFGIIDLCVTESCRGRGIATRLLEETERLARQAGIEALVLIASDHRIYQRFGFTLLNAQCSWLKIDEHRHHGIASEDLSGELMTKTLSPDLTLEGPVDFLGYLF